MTICGPRAAEQVAKRSRRMFARLSSRCSSSRLA